MRQHGQNIRATSVMAGLLWMLCSTQASACGAPLHERYDSLDALIRATDNIVLARFSCVDTPELSCRFNREVVITGASEPQFFPRHWRRNAYEAVRTDSVQALNDFNAHRDQAFWQMTTSRAGGPGPQCTPRFTFQPGEHYLLFLDSPASPYAAELIRSADDAWLQYVCKQTASAACARLLQ